MIEVTIFFTKLCNIFLEKLSFDYILVQSCTIQTIKNIIIFIFLSLSPKDFDIPSYKYHASFVSRGRSIILASISFCYHGARKVIDQVA